MQICKILSIVTIDYNLKFKNIKIIFPACQAAIRSWSLAFSGLGADKVDHMFYGMYLIEGDFKDWTVRFLRRSLHILDGIRPTRNEFKHLVIQDPQQKI